MGKLEENKKSKRSSLLSTAYDLFINNGFAGTTIADISKKAGLAKGTFYLYFRDKYDVRDQLVIRKSGQLVQEAQAAVSLYPEAQKGFEPWLLAMTDYILHYLQHNRHLLRFIAKNLSWGVFEHAASSTGDSDNFAEIYSTYLLILEKYNIHCEEPELLLFTLIELISSTGYSCILYETPTTLDTYLPYLHRSIHHILLAFTTPSDGAVSDAGNDSAAADGPAAETPEDAAAAEKPADAAAEETGS